MFTLLRLSFCSPWLSLVCPLISDLLWETPAVDVCQKEQNQDHVFLWKWVVCRDLRQRNGRRWWCRKVNTKEDLTSASKDQVLLLQTNNEKCVMRRHQVCSSPTTRPRMQRTRQRKWQRKIPDRVIWATTLGRPVSMAQRSEHVPSTLSATDHLLCGLVRMLFFQFLGKLCSIFFSLVFRIAYIFVIIISTVHFLFK